MLIRLVLHFFLLTFITVINCSDQIQRQEKCVLESAQNENRPIVAVFLSPECPWSKKLQQEVLENPSFTQKIKTEAILWQISIDQREEAKIFLQKYSVPACPLFLLLDPKGKEFARLEYVPLDAKGYAEALIRQIENFQEICLALDQGEEAFEEKKWKDLYLKAQKLSPPYFQQVILEQGLRNEKGSYFHLEKFIKLLEQHKLKHPQVLKAKKQLLLRDPQNVRGVHFKVAALEFQKMAKRQKSKDRPERALMPLMQYIRKFGKKDPENYWKSEWMIAEFLFTRNSTVSAIEHAKTALTAAPEAVKMQIAETIALMEGK